MSDFKAKMHQIRFRLGLRPRPQTPLGELTALPQTPKLDLRGLLLREGKGRGAEGTDGRGGGKEGPEGVDDVFHYFRRA